MDESGDHSLEKIDPEYPVFVLGGCMVDYEYHETVMTPSLSKYKLDLFSQEDFIIHTADITRRRGIFNKLTDKDFRMRFYQETNRLMESFGFQYCGLSIREKRQNIAGLQIADLVVSPIGRYVLGKQPKEDWRIIESKLRRSRSGKYEGHGLIVLPRL